MSENILMVVGDNIVKGIGNFESKIKACFASSTVINGDQNVNFSGIFLGWSNNNPIKTDGFVSGNFIIQIIIEMTDMVLDRGVAEAVANLHGWDFSLEEGDYLWYTQLWVMIF